MSPFGALPVQCFPDALPHLDAIQAKGIVGTQEQVLRLFRLTNVQVLNAGARENPQTDECEVVPPPNGHLSHLKWCLKHYNRS